VVDEAFLLLMAAAGTLEIVVGKNWRHFKMAAMLGLLAAANLAFHLEAHVAGLADHATRAGIAGVRSRARIGARTGWVAGRLSVLPVPFPGLRQVTPLLLFRDFGCDSVPCIWGVDSR
jgi:uncharacterized protein involved in response to NO